MGVINACEVVQNI